MPKPDALVRPLLNWFARGARDLPWRHTRDPYAVWISEVMLQQTQVKTVIPYWQRWMRAVPTVQALARARPEGILKLWEGLGYYTRARNLQRAARLVVERHRGRFPENFLDVLALPGIGRYTAGAICSIAFDQPTPVLDGNVLRVLTRVFGIGENPRAQATRRRLWGLAETLVLRAAGLRRDGRRNCADLNQALMELGATVCAPREPACPTCPLRRLCVARREGRTEELPSLERVHRSTRRHFVALVLARGGRFLVRRRPAGVVNARLWEFPNFEVPTAPSRVTPRPAGRFAEELRGVPQCRWQPLTQIKHTITRYRITLEVFHATLARPTKRAEITGRWCLLAELQRLPFTSAHRKIVRRLEAGSGRRPTAN